MGQRGGRPCLLWDWEDHELSKLQRGRYSHVYSIQHRQDCYIAILIAARRKAILVSCMQLVKTLTQPLISTMLQYSAALPL